MQKGMVTGSLAFGLFLMGLGLAPSQNRQNGTLTIRGHSGESPVIRAGGRSYVDVEGLARITNGSLSFSGNQIILTLPGVDGSPGTHSPTAAEAASSQGFSRDFLRAGIEA